MSLRIRLDSTSHGVSLWHNDKEGNFRTTSAAMIVACAISLIPLSHPRGIVEACKHRQFMPSFLSFLSLEVLFDTYIQGVGSTEHSDIHKCDAHSSASHNRLQLCN